MTGYGECFKNLLCWRGALTLKQLLKLVMLARCWLLGSAINPLDDTPNQPTTATATTTHHRAAAATAGAAAAAAATWLTHDIPLPTKPEPPWLMRSRRPRTTPSSGPAWGLWPRHMRLVGGSVLCTTANTIVPLQLTRYRCHHHHALWHTISMAVIRPHQPEPHEQGCASRAWAKRRTPPAATRYVHGARDRQLFSW